MAALLRQVPEPVQAMEPVPVVIRCQVARAPMAVVLAVPAAARVMVPAVALVAVLAVPVALAAAANQVLCEDRCSTESACPVLADRVSG